MALELTSLVFKTETSDLERASKVIGELVTNVGKLDKAARTAAQTEATLARAAKDSAKANLDNAKAQDTRLKSTITADKADQQAAAAIERKTKATDRASTAIKKNADMLQLQNDTYDFILEGFSKGDAKVLAMAKATGQLSDQLKQVLTDIRQFSKNTFDQTETGLDRMVKSAKEASSAQGFLNNGLNLTSKQAKELSNDLDRLNIRLQHQGKSYQEITKEQAIYKQRFVEEANAVNRATSALAAVEKQRKDVVSATNYLTQAEAKMSAALNTSNVALDKAGTDSLVKYEAALRKSGISQDVATAKLAKYKAQLEQVQIQEQKRREQHLARALQPQFTDIAVSLYSGQAPLTVLLQQSGQMVDLFKLSGIEADNLGKVMREAFASMIPAIAEVAKGLTSLVFESFMSAGSAVTRFVGNVTGITAAMEIAKRAIVSGGEANFKYIASLDKIGNTFSAVAATGIAAMIAGMILLGLEYKKIIQAEAELTNALATSGGALGISKTEAIAAAEGMASLGVGTLKAVAAITEIAKSGNIGKESIDLITKSAVDLEKTAGISIEETVKQFAKLQEEPAKALTEIAQKTGLVNKATLDSVYALEQQGDKTKAARIATIALASVNAQVAAEVRDNWSPIEALWKDIKSAIGNVKQEIYDLTTSNAVVGALRTAWETVAVVISEVWFTIKGVGKEIGGIGAQIAAVMQGDFSGAAEIGRMMKADAASAAEEQKKYVEAILNRTSVEQKSFNQSKAQNSQYVKWRQENDQALDKSISKTDKYKAKELEMQKAVLAGTVSQIEADKALAGWKKIILGEEKTKKDPSENYYATLMREATNNTIAANTATQELTKSEQKLLEVRSDPRFEKLTATQKQDVISKYEAAIAAEKQTALTEKLAEAEELRGKILGTVDGLGKDYYKTIDKLNALVKSGAMGQDEANGLVKALGQTTPFAKAMSEWFAKATEAVAKSNIETKLQLANIQAQNMELDHNLAMVGLSEEAQKRLTIEFTKQRDLMKASAEYEKIRSSIMNDGSYGTDENKNKALANAASVYKATLAQINRKAVDDLFVYYTSKAAEAGKNSFGSFAEVLKSAGELSFSNAVSSIGELINSFGTLIEQQTIYNKLRSEAKGDSEKLSKLDKAAAQNQMKSYGDITKSLKGFFKEGTKGYKALHTAEKVFRAFELAMAVKNAAVKIAQEYAVMTARITGDQAATASAVASSSTIVAAKGAEASASAVAAVANQGTRDPYTAFAGIAAMIAIMAGLGLMVGKSGGSGVQKSNQGTGTVFGDSSAKSESINNSLGLLEEVNTLTMRYSAEMLRSLRSIENTLSGVTNIILRSNGMAASAAGIVEGTQTSSFGKVVGSVVGTVLGGVVGTLIGGVVGKLFGTKTKITGQGVMVQDVSYQDILAGNVEAGYYTDVNRKKKFLGVTTSSKNSTNYKADAELSDQFSKLLNGFVDTIKAAGPILGVSLDTIDNNLEDFVLKIGKIDLKDLKGDEINEKLMAVFGAAGDDLAKEALPGFEKYQQAGEGYLETIVRLASTVESVRGSLDTLNSAFVLSVDNAMELVDAFGDLDKLTKAMSDYNQSYYTEAERNATLQRQLTREFTAQNLKLPTTKEEYRKLVEAQDLNTEAGRKMYAFLLTLAPAFAEIADSAEQLANDRTDIVYRMMEQEALLLEAQGRSVEADKKRRELLDKQRGAEYERLMKVNPELARLTAELWALEDAAVAAANAAALEREISDNRRDYTDRILQQEAELLDAQGRTAEADRKRRELLDRQRARENERLMALNPELAKLAYELWLLEDATAAATRAAKERKEISDDLYNALVKAVDAEKTLLNEQKARLEETISTLKAVFDILKSSVEDLYGEVSSTAAMQASEGRGVIDQAIATGILPDSKLLDTSIQAVRDEISNSLYVSKADADKARLIFAAQLALLKDTTEEQLTDAEKQLKAVNAQISYLDNILKTAKEQLDAFLGNTEVLKSVDKALADLYAYLQTPQKPTPTDPVPTPKPGTGGSGGGAVFGGSSGGGGGGGSSQSYSYYRPVGLGTSIGYQPVTDEATISRLDSLSSLYHSFDGTGDLVGLLNSIKAAGGTMYDLEALSGHFYNDWVKAGMSVGIPAFADGGYYQGGMALVGEEGPELINFSNPGQVYTARQTASMLSGESSEVVAELKAVRSEIIMLRAEVRADVSHNAKTAKLLDRVIPEGDSVQVTIS